MPFKRLLIIRASAGEKASTFRFMPLAGRFPKNIAARSTSPVLLAKAAAAVDSLEIQIADNGCDIPSEIPTWQNGAHICYEFEGCDERYPVKVCTSGDAHTDPG